MIKGKLRQLGSQRAHDAHEPTHWLWYGVSLLVGLLLSVLLLVAAVQLLMPRLVYGAATSILEKPWHCLGRGIAIALLFPAVIALLMLTVIGIPVGLATMAAYALLLPTAYVAIAYCVGLYVRGWFGKKEQPQGRTAKIMWTLAGIGILALIALVPLLGWALLLLAMIAGLGAVIGQLGPALRATGSS